MNKKLDIVQELGHKFKLKRADFNTSVFLMETKTPAHSFIRLIAPVENTDCFFTLTSRDFFDVSLAQSIVNFANANSLCIEDGASKIIEGFHANNYGFDRLLLINELGGRFAEASPKLDKKTFEIMPIYRCEFVGDEDLELIDLIRHNFVTTIDWKRGPKPIVKARYRTTNSGERSIGNKFGLTRLEVILQVIPKLREMEGSFLDMKNYLGQECHIVRKLDNYQINIINDSNSIFLKKEEIEPWIKDFLIKGKS